MKLAVTLKAALDLCRVSNLPTVWTNVLAAALLAGVTSPGEIGLLAGALSFFYLAGMCLNDLCDLGCDRKERPGRPLPSGRISVAGARLLTCALFGAGFLSLWFAPCPSGALATALLLSGAIVLYDLRHKKHPLSVFVMASCRFLVFAVTAVALSGTLPSVVLLAAALQAGYVVLISVVARHENRRREPFSFAVIPTLLAGISLLDGVLLALLLQPVWLWAGVAGAVLTRGGQRYVRGD